MFRKLVTETDLRDRLALNVRRLRNAAGVTVKTASGRVQMHWRHWQKIEAGHTNATLATLVRIAEALDVDPAALLCESSRGSSKLV